MTSKNQLLGDKGENLVRSKILCPRCKRKDFTLRTLPRNFKCADLICDFCGYLAQVKSLNVDENVTLPKTILGAAWGPQQERMEAGIFIPIFIVLFPISKKLKFKIFYLPSDLQTIEMFIPRKPLSDKARRAGWQGYTIDLSKAASSPIEIF